MQLRVGAILMIETGRGAKDNAVNFCGDAPGPVDGSREETAHWLEGDHARFRNHGFQEFEGRAVRRLGLAPGHREARTGQPSQRRMGATLLLLKPDYSLPCFSS